MYIRLSHWVISRRKEEKETVKCDHPHRAPKPKSVTVIESPLDAEAKKYIELFSHCIKKKDPT